MAVAIYARVSTTRQADNELSIPDQLKQTRKWCHENGHLIAHEYVEAGASATDDRRPEFQQMMADACAAPAPYELIVVHSMSRFYRDPIGLGVSARKLKKSGVRVVSITQPLPDDNMGELLLTVISSFDGYMSKENAKHVSRTMIENARQGYFNGASPPFGYCTVATDRVGNRGRMKRKLAINDAEAAVVRIIYDLYLSGQHGRSMGGKEIAKYLNERNYSMRGRRWGIQKVWKILSSRTYCGECYYNVIDTKSKKQRPPSEWVLVPVPAIVSSETFERVRQLRESRQPSKTPPRQLSSPVLLTGLLKCGHCGGAMTLATGKGGQYRYYKCVSRMNAGNAYCPSRNIPVEMMDGIVMKQVEKNILSRERIVLSNHLLWRSSPERSA
jgi:site-specific DNA recombinase